VKTAYKLRFLPLAITGFGFAAALIMRFALALPVSGKALRLCGLLAFASFIFLQAMREAARNKKQKEETPEPVKTERELRGEAIGGEIKLLLHGNIPIRAVYSAFSALLFLGGLGLIFSNGEIVFGLIISGVGLFSTLYSVYWLTRYIKRLKALKRRD